MVLTRSQYENMSKEELIQELSDIKSSFVNDINAKLTGLILMNSHPNMTRFTLNCSSVKALILIFSTELFRWSAMLLQTPSIAEEKQLKQTLCLQKFKMMFWRQASLKRHH